MIDQPAGLGNGQRRPALERQARTGSARRATVRSAEPAARVRIRCGGSLACPPELQAAAAGARRTGPRLPSIAGRVLWAGRRGSSVAARLVRGKGKGLEKHDAQVYRRPRRDGRRPVRDTALRSPPAGGGQQQQQLRRPSAAPSPSCRSTSGCIENKTGKPVTDLSRGIHRSSRTASGRRSGTSPSRRCVGGVRSWAEAPAQGGRDLVRASDEPDLPDRPRPGEAPGALEGHRRAAALRPRAAAAPGPGGRLRLQPRHHLHDRPRADRRASSSGSRRARADRLRSSLQMSGLAAIYGAKLIPKSLQRRSTAMFEGSRPPRVPAGGAGATADKRSRRTRSGRPTRRSRSRKRWQGGWPRPPA